MSSQYSRRTLSMALFVSYVLVVTLCAPFSIQAKSRSLRNSRGAPRQEQIPAAHRAGELLVRFRAGVSRQTKDLVIAAQGAKRQKELKGDSGFEALELPPGHDARAAASQLLLNPQVAFAEPNFLISKDDLTPNDNRFNEQWALRNTGQNGGQFGSDVKASSAWSTTTVME